MRENAYNVRPTRNDMWNFNFNISTYYVTLWGIKHTEIQVTLTVIAKVLRLEKQWEIKFNIERQTSDVAKTCGWNLVNEKKLPREYNFDEYGRGKLGLKWRGIKKDCSQHHDREKCKSHIFFYPLCLFGYTHALIKSTNREGERERELLW